MTPPVLTQRVAAYGLLRRADSVLLVLARGGSALAGTWLLPGGGVEHGEHPEEALVREVEEETGYRCAPGELVGVHSETMDVGPRSARVHTVGLVYRARILSGELRDEVGGSSERAAWVPLSETTALRLAPFTAEAVAGV